MIGQQVPGQGALLRRMLAHGHELANHSWNHANLGGGGPAASSQLARTNAAIRTATGFTPCVFPPAVRQHERRPRRARQRARPDVGHLERRPAGLAHARHRRDRRPRPRQTGPGGIILGHDGGGNRTQSLAAAPQIISGLRARGYRFVTVSRLLGYAERITLRR